jgi:hypothetical protein
MINEHVLPNPFKSEGSDHLDHVLAEIERDLIDYNEPLPTFLDRRFLERLHGSVEQASPAHHSRGHRIVNLLKMQLSRQP